MLFVFYGDKITVFLSIRFCSRSAGDPARGFVLLNHSDGQEPVAQTLWKNWGF